MASHTEGERVGILLYYPGSLKFHPSVVNSAIEWAKSGSSVDIFKCFNPDEGFDSNDEIRIIHTGPYRGNPFLRFFSVLRFASVVFSRVRERNYKVLIGVDAYGLIIAGIVSFFLKTRVAYLSLEILSTKSNYVSLKQKGFAVRTAYVIHHATTKMMEKYFHRRACLTIIQDAKRWEALCRLNKVRHDADVIFVPNSPLKDDGGPPPNSRYLRKKYAIPDRKRVVLYAGSLGKWTGIDRVLANVRSWPDDVVFVIHGRGNPEFVESLGKEIEKRYPQGVYLSLEQLREDEYNALLRSADVGIVWYNDAADPNVYTIGAASGKMFYYLKFGLPVITNNWPGLPEIVDSHKCGVCVENEEGMGAAIGMVLQDYRSYSENAVKCFESYEFSRHYQKVIERLK